MKWSLIAIGAIFVTLHEEREIIVDFIVIFTLLELIPRISQMEVFDELSLLSHVEFYLVENTLICYVGFAWQPTSLYLGGKSHCVSCTEALH